MDIGMPTLIETYTLDECARLCHKLKLQFIELNMNLPQYQINKIDVTEFKAIAEKYGIYYTIHLDENLNVSDFNPYVAEAYTHTVKDTIETAKSLGVPILNMHLSSGVYFTLPDKKVFLFDEYEKQYLNSIKVFRDICEKAVGEFDIKICIENCSGYTEFQNKALDLLFKSPVFALTFDIGHYHCTGEIDRPIITKYIDKLCHMHIHDAANKRNKKDHLALGTGELNLPKYFNIARQHNCRIVLETKTIAGLMQSVKWIDGRI